MGLAEETALVVLQNSGYGPVLVLVRDTRLALGRGEAAKVLVEQCTT
jgi:ferrous iron transport protein A